MSYVLFFYVYSETNKTKITIITVIGLVKKNVYFIIKILFVNLFGLNKKSYLNVKCYVHTGNTRTGE